MKTLINRLLGYIQESNAYVFLLSKILPNVSINYLGFIPLLSWSPFYNKPSNPKFDRWGYLYKKGLANLRKGDLVFSYNKRKVTSNVIGRFSNPTGFAPSHVEYCKGGVAELIGMHPKGCIESTFADMCFESTRIVIKRCIDFDTDYIEKMNDSLHKIKETNYDFSFFMDNEELSCSEAIYYLDHVLNDGIIKVNPEPVIGYREYVTPTGLFKSKNLITVWDSDLETDHGE